MAALQASLLLCKLSLSPKRFSPSCALDRPFRASDLRHSNFRRSSPRVASVPCAIRPENNLSSDSGKESSSGSGGSEDWGLGGGNEVVPEKKSSGNSAAEKVAMRRIPAVALVMGVLAAILRACRKVFSWFEPFFLGLFGLEPTEDTEFEYDSKGFIIGTKVKSPENAKTFKDVKGCNEAKQELEEIVEFLKNPGKFTRLGGKLPKGILLQGAPGTGKTLLAKAIAGEAGVPFLYRSGSEFDDMYVGVGPGRVRSLFEEARKKAPCIIFIDEIDAIGSDRRKSGNQALNETLNQLLVEMDGFRPNEGIILLAATNLPEILDPALKRAGRFDRHIVVPVPDVKGRQEILELYMQDKPLGDDINVKSLALDTSKFTGADLENLVNIAAIRAAVEGADKISAAHIEFAKDRILMGTSKKTILSEETKKLIAYHESGHVIVALNIEGAPPIHKVTIVPRGSLLGMVSHIPNDDEKSVSDKKQLLAHIDVCMGGRAAEELIFGKDHITSGASSDLKNATKLARRMVSRYGMSDIIGPVHVTDRSSSEMLLHIDAEAGKILRESYDRAQVLIKKHEKALHTLANALLEHETLNEKEIKQALLPNTGGQVPEQRKEPVQQQQGGGDLVPA